MDNLNVSLPYPVGTYLTRIHLSVPFIDQVREYRIKEDGVYTILSLDTLTEHSKDVEVSLEQLVNKWTVSTEKEVEFEKSKQRVLKY